MTIRFTKEWPTEVKEYIDTKITADFDTGTLYRDGKEIKGSLTGPKPKQYLAFGCKLSGKFRILKIHQVIFYLYHGKQASLLIDHIDGDQLNNSIHNLREVTKKQNSQNMVKATRTKTSVKLKGVYPRKNSKGYWATIRCNGVSHYLGQFTTAEDAARAYDTASIRLHGEYGKRNFS